MGVEFRTNATAIEIPDFETVSETLIQGVVNASATFNISVRADSIQVIQTPVFSPTTASSTIANFTTSAATINSTTTITSSPTAVAATMVPSLKPSTIAFQTTAIVGFTTTFKTTSTITFQPIATTNEQKATTALNKQSATTNSRVSAIQPTSATTTSITDKPTNTTTIGTTDSTVKLTTEITPPDTITKSTNNPESKAPIATTNQSSATTTRDKIIGSTNTTTRLSTIKPETTADTNKPTTTTNTTTTTTTTNATPTTTTTNATTTTTTTNATTTTTTTNTTPTTTTTKATTTTTTTKPTTTTTTTKAPPPPVFVVAAVLIHTFEPELEDKNSKQFKALETQVVVLYEFIYRTRFGPLFLRCFVIAFKPAAGRTRAVETEAEMGVEFRTNATAKEIPDSETVKETLIQGVVNASATFNISVRVDSIQVIQTPTINSTSVLSSIASFTATSISAMTVTSSPATVPAPIVTALKPLTTDILTTATSNTMNTITTTMTITTPTTTTTNTEIIITRQMRFRSAGETFTTDLLDSSSVGFRSRALLLKSILEPYYKQAFFSFRYLTVISFSNGSIFNNMNLGFASTFVPSSSQIANVLINAASDITAFNIDLNSITVDGTLVSNGVSHKISLITASWMVLLSWLLSSQQ